MEISDEIMQVIKENSYDQELLFTFIRELLESDKEYDI